MDVLGVDSHPSEVFDRRWSKKISANPCHHRDLGTTEACRHRLIRTFATESQIELLAKNGFARFGETISERCKVDVCAANDCYVRSFLHPIRIPGLTPEASSNRVSRAASKQRCLINPETVMCSAR